MDTSSPRWSLRLLGDFQLSERMSGEKVALPGKRERVLLAYLALSPNGRQPRRKLVTLLWGEAADETTLENLRTSIFNVRKALGDTERRIIGSEDRDIVLETSAFQVDVLDFRRLAAGQNTGDLAEAAKLYLGDFLEGLSIESEEFESWRREEASSFRDLTIDVLKQLMTQLANSGQTERAIETGKRILRLEPLHEAAVRGLMLLYAQSGRRAAAVELYRTLGEGLKKELGAQPEAETRAVYAEITRGGDERIAIVADTKPSLAAPTIARTNEARSAPAEHSPAVPVVFSKLRKRTVGWVAGGLAAVVAIAILLLVSVAPSTAPSGRPPTVLAATSNSAIALAVLPFANLSTEQDQEFFSDGLTDEIASALARVPDLRIVARTSAFEFKGKNRNITTIGEQLGATHLIEGSVRRAGDRVRVTLQLIRADDGTRIWSDDYDRQLTDIFAIQEDIARAVASSLSVPLGLQQGENLVSNRSIDAESYQQFLRARALILARGESRLDQAAVLLERVVVRNPEYAPAWALLAQDYSLMPIFHPERGQSPTEFRRVVDDLLQKAEAAAQRTVQLDPNSAGGHRTLGYLQYVRGKLLLAEDLYKQALALDANNPDQGYSLLLAEVGRLKEANAIKQQLQALEPFVPLYNSTTARWLWVEGQNDDAAIAILKALPPGSGVGSLPGLAMIYASLGRYGEAADLLENLPAEDAAEPYSKDAARLLRTAPARAAAPQSLPSLGGLGWVYLHIGAPERALENYERNIQEGFAGGAGLPNIWHVSWAPVRKTERFKAYVRARGLVDYWRVKGWPQWCHPTIGDDFVCE
jgi:TolB-like protein/DNA-binding SARP family transcriptional activator